MKTKLATILDVFERVVYTETIIPQGYTTNHKMTFSQLPKGSYSILIENSNHRIKELIVKN